MITKLWYRKSQQEGFVETPSRRVTRSRASISPDVSDTADSSSAAPSKRVTRSKAASPTNGSAAPEKATTNGSAEKHEAVENPSAKPPNVEYTEHFEFGGSWGVLAMMILFPALMYYMWLGATYYGGRLPLPAEGQTFAAFLGHMGGLIYEGAFPSLKAWTIYWTFFVFEALCYIFLPGITVKGRPLEHLGGKQLPYYCSAVSSFYTTIVVAIGIHVTGLFKLYTIMNEFGPLMSVAILSGFLVSIIAYVSALFRGVQHRITGYHVYDFFMGAELNPRMFGILDFKMFFEVRLPWYILLLVTMGAAARQYEVYGYVTGEVCFLLLAHFLYANACSKGEELIIPTWFVRSSPKISHNVKSSY